MTKRRRASTLRHIGIGLVGTTTVAIIAMVFVVAGSVTRTADRAAQLSNALSGIGSAHREIMMMRVISRESTPDTLDRIRLRRGLLGQQLRLSYAGMYHADDSNPWVGRLELALAEVDDLLQAQAGTPIQPGLVSAIDALEVFAKRTYDFEDNRYIELVNEALAAKARSHRLLQTLAVATAVLGASLLAWVQRSARHDLRQKAAELAEALHSPEASQTQRAHLLDQTVKAAERERVRLAAEIHDGSIQSLSAIGYDLDRLEIRLQRGMCDDVLELAGRVRERLAGEVDGLRRLMSELRPPVLDQGGLSAAICDLVNDFATRTGTQCAVTADVEVGRLTSDVETIAYRVTQEALANVARHSRASRVRVSVVDAGTRVDLAVEDDGIGFDTGRAMELVRDEHFGLAGMRERVEMADGAFCVTSTQGGGTRISASLPTARILEAVQA